MRSAFTSARMVSTERPRQYSHSAERFGASSLHIFYPASCSYLLVPASASTNLLTVSMLSVEMAITILRVRQVASIYHEQSTGRQWL